MRRQLALAVSLLGFTTPRISAQDTTSVQARNDSVSVRFVEAEFRAVIRALATMLPAPVVVGDVPTTKISFETPRPIPRVQIAAVLKGLLESQGLDLVQDSVLFRVVTKVSERPPRDVGAPGGTAGPELRVIRLKHARAADVAATINLLFGGGGRV